MDTNNKDYNQAGVSMVQFVIAFPVFMMFVIVIIDMGRITALSNVIRESMALGMQEATSVANLDIDPRGLNTTDFDYQRSKIARDMVQEASLQLIGGLGKMVATDDDATLAAADAPKLYDLVYTEDRIADGPDATTFKIAVLLPGECVEVPAIGVTECNRETLNIDAADPFPAQPPEFLIKNHPVKLVAFAHFNSFTPWLFRDWQRFEQFGFRQPIPRGPYPTSVDPQPYVELAAVMDPEEQEPLNEAELPEEEPTGLIIDWERCLRQTIVFATTSGDSYCPEISNEDPSFPGQAECNPDGCRPS